MTLEELQDDKKFRDALIEKLEFENKQLRAMLSTAHAKVKECTKELWNIKAARSCSNCAYELFKIDTIPCSLCDDEYSKWELGSP